MPQFDMNLKRQLDIRNVDSGSITNAAAVGLTEAKLLLASGLRVEYALITIEDDTIRYWMNGDDPTAAAGHRIYADQYFEVTGYNNIKNLKMIATSGTAKYQASLG